MEKIIKRTEYILFKEYGRGTNYHYIRVSTDTKIKWVVGYSNKDGLVSILSSIECDSLSLEREYQNFISTETSEKKTVLDVAEEIRIEFNKWVEGQINLTGEYQDLVNTFFFLKLAELKMGK